MPEVKFKSRLNALFPKVFQAARVLEQNLTQKPSTPRGNTGLNLATLGARDASEVVVFKNATTELRESDINFNDGSSESIYTASFKVIRDNPLLYLKGSLSDSKNLKLLLLLASLDFVFRLELLKTNLESNLFIDPKKYWENFNRNILHPLKVDSLALMKRLKSDHADFMNKLNPLIVQAKIVATKWINSLHSLGERQANRHTENPTLLTELAQLTGTAGTESKWNEFLEPLHKAS